MTYQRNNAQKWPTIYDQIDNTNNCQVINVSQNHAMQIARAVHNVYKRCSKHPTIRDSLPNDLPVPNAFAIRRLGDADKRTCGWQLSETKQRQSMTNVQTDGCMQIPSSENYNVHAWIELKACHRSPSKTRRHNSDDATHHSFSTTKYQRDQITQNTNELQINKLWSEGIAHNRRL